MNKSKTLLLLTGISLLCISLSVGVAINNTHRYINPVKADEYEMICNASQNKLHTSSSTTYGSKVINTESGNKVTLTYFNVSKSSDSSYWQGISQNGFIANLDALTGLNSLTIVPYSDSGSLKIRWGNMINPIEKSESIIISDTNPITCYFNNEKPNYFAIYNLESTEVEITSIAFNYSCVNVSGYDNGDDAIVSPDNKLVAYGKYPQYEVINTDIKSELEGLGVNENVFFTYQQVKYVRSGDKYFYVSPIRWKVLRISDGIYTLISDMLLDTHTYDDDGATDYIGTGIRNWLLDVFYKKVFPSDDNILYLPIDRDEVTLLTQQEIRSSYSSVLGTASDKSKKIAYVTDYAKANGAFNSNLAGRYWTRTAASGNIYYVATNGDYNGSYAPETTGVSVRPYITIYTD